MGSSTSWLAVRGESDAVQRELGLEPIGSAVNQKVERFLGGRLEGGWYLVQVGGCDHPIIDASSLGPLSLRFDVVACSIEEHVMYCAAWFWSKGEQVWSVVHQSENGPEHLDSHGNLPNFFPEIRDRYFREQETGQEGPHLVDFIFEIPTRLAQRLTGFHHDEWPETLVVEEFRRAKGDQKKRWWRFW
jgi:hypothetical protein